MFSEIELEESILIFHTLNWDEQLQFLLDNKSQLEVIIVHGEQQFSAIRLKNPSQLKYSRIVLLKKHLIKDSDIDMLLNNNITINISY